MHAVDLRRPPSTATAGVADGHVLDALATATLDATAALVLVCDRAGRILLANPALQRFTGRSREDLREALLYDVVVQPQETEIARSGVAAVFAGEPAIPGEVDWLDGTGASRRIELQTSVLADEEGQAYALAFVGIDVTVHRQREARTRRLAMTDPLTGVANRSALFAALRMHLDPLGGRGCGLLFCDLDDFKTVNDRYGHAVGDRLLVALAERLRRSCGPEDVVARLGGDEFVVVSPAAGDEALTVHERRLAALIEQPFELDGVVVAIGGSVGCAVGAPGEEPDHVVARADLEMYGVKGVRRRARRRAPAEH